MESKLKAAIFDMDGLMIDTERVYAEGWVLGAKRLGFDLPQSFISDAAGRSIDNNILELMKLTDDMELVSAIRSVREEYFFTSLDEGKITLKPHLLELLKTLRNAGIKTAVATSSYRSRVQKVFERYQLSPLFDVTITGDEVSQVKPDPEIYLTALNQLGVSRDEAIILEDSLTGARAANNAQIAFALVPDSSSKKRTKTPNDLAYLRISGTDLQVIEKWLLEKNFHINEEI